MSSVLLFNRDGTSKKADHNQNGLERASHENLRNKE